MFQSVMNEFKDSRFKSYIDDSCGLENIPLNDCRTKLLDGEVIVREVPKVLMYTSLSDPNKTKLGVLAVTNFKLSFMPETDDDDNGCYQQNLYLGPYDVCLSSIDIVYQMGDKSKKKLALGQNVSGRIKELLIICKNMRTFHFNLKGVDKDIARHITNTILYHVAPKRLHLLFTFDFTKHLVNSKPEKPHSFQSHEDWMNELVRTKCSGSWRVCTLNEHYILCHLPKRFVVPSSVDDNTLTRAAEHFRDRYCPVWVWGRNNTSLVRMAELNVSGPERTQENVMLELIRKSHNKLQQPILFELTQILPSLKDLQQSFNKLRELCTPDNARSFKTQDSKFYSLLEGSRWLKYVSLCLKCSGDAADHLDKDRTVVLQEGTGRDMNCIVSSLTQLMLDPVYRSIDGFQILIQKDWIVLGHPFQSRLGLLEDDSNEPAPYFLLFLDCVWQLLRQFPSAFQFSETYLTTLWDSVHISIFDTFVFNCQKERDVGASNHSVFNWKCQFTKRDLRLFDNPLYDETYKPRIVAESRVSSLDLWRQCYLRWLPGIEITNGGRPQIDLSCRIIKSDIDELQRKLRSHDHAEINSRDASEVGELLRKVNSFYPFSRTSQALPDSDLVSNDGLDTQSILNLNTE